MFFRKEQALRLLRQIEQRVRPGGRADRQCPRRGHDLPGNVQTDEYYLFGTNELEQAFAGWTLLVARHDSFPAAEGTRKEFATVIAQKAQSRRNRRPTGTPNFFSLPMKCLRNLATLAAPPSCSTAGRDCAGNTPGAPTLGRYGIGRRP